MSITNSPTTNDKDNDSSKGLKAWEERRKAWLTPNQTYLEAINNNNNNHIDNREKNDDSMQLSPFEQFLSNEAQRLHIYKQLVTQRYALRTPLPLKYIIPVLVTGWQEDGVWPKGMVVKETSD
ncbi:hypothetical protein BDF20DRAFT_911513 [Mycotypha africana]|uniref:uncharacterized protein n=1 Tax=Mycotypha africana TaxID=64632 RepID=UPI0023013408|nr:uncharacterized protein BDF20DRAFT_911513 [Mycotypha africana]KAI8984412.1 hypothetical protein BDF20DRAFT_911513 [Mycotypha africana]